MSPVKLGPVCFYSPSGIAKGVFLVFFWLITQIHETAFFKTVRAGQRVCTFVLDARSEHSLVQ